MRYLPHTDAERRAMLAAIGAPSVDALFADVPAAARLARPLDLPPAQGELAVERAIAAMAEKNGPSAAAWFLPARPRICASTRNSGEWAGRSTGRLRRALAGTAANNASAEVAPMTASMSARSALEWGRYLMMCFSF